MTRINYRRHSPPTPASSCGIVAERSKIELRIKNILSFKILDSSFEQGGWLVNRSQLKHFNQGLSLPLVLIATAIFLVFTSILLSGAFSNLDLVKRQGLLNQTISAAESGVHFALWHSLQFQGDYNFDSAITQADNLDTLAADPNKYENGCPKPDFWLTPPSNNFPFKNAQEIEIGQFQLRLKPPCLGSTTITVEATGWLHESSNLKRTILAQLGIPSFSEYAIVSDQPFWITSGINIRGKLHSNQGITFDGVNVNKDPITSAVGFANPQNCQSPAGGWLPPTALGGDGTTCRDGVWSNNPSHPDRTTFFPLSPNIPFQGITAEIGSIRTKADANGRCFGPVAPPWNAFDCQGNALSHGGGNQGLAQDNQKPTNPTTNPSNLVDSFIQWLATQVLAQGVGLNPPNPPTLKSPADQSTNVSRNPRLEWFAESTGTATDYGVQVALDPNFNNVVFTEHNITNLYYDVPQNRTLLFGTQYFWRVRARNANNGTFSNPSTTWSFITIPVPGAPNLVSPGNGSTNVPRSSVALSWSQGSGGAPTHYKLEYSTTADFSSGTTLIDWTSWTTSVTIGPLAYGTTYYWRVKAAGITVSTIQESPWSVVWSFSTEPPPPTPGSPIHQSPGNGATNVSRIGLQLTWLPDGGSPPTHFQLQYSTSSNFSSEVTTVGWDPWSTSYTLPKLKYQTTYYWRVKARNTDSNPTDSQWSTAWSFTTVTLPGAPTLLSPSNEASNQPKNGLVLSWQAGSGGAPVHYWLEIATSPGFSANSIKVSINAAAWATQVTINGLQYSSTYYWRVRAGDNDVGQQGPWSMTWSFATQQPPPPPGPPIPIDPTDGETTSSKTPTFSWSAPTVDQNHGPATSYKIRYEKRDPAGGWGNRVETGWLGNVFSWTVNACLDPNAEYRWSAKSSGEGGEGTWSDWEHFLTPSQSPPVSQVSLWWPSNNAINQSVANLYLYWNDNGGSRYHLEVATSPNLNAQNGFSSGVIYSNNNILPTGYTVDWQNITPPNLNYQTTYYWHVRAANACGDYHSTNWSPVWQFTTVVPPSAIVYPENQAPADQSTGVPTITPVRWSYPSQAASISSWWVQFGPNKNPSSQPHAFNQLQTPYCWKFIGNDPSVRETTLPQTLPNYCNAQLQNWASTFPNNQTVYWVVWGWNGYQWVLSNATQFTTVSPVPAPSQPIHQSPADCQVQSPNHCSTFASVIETLTWAAGQGGGPPTQYRVQVTTDGDLSFQTPIWDSDWQTWSTSAQIPAGLLQNKTFYRWRVNACNHDCSAAQQSGWTTPWRFETELLPADGYGYHIKLKQNGRFDVCVVRAVNVLGGQPPDEGGQQVPWLTKIQDENCLASLQDLTSNNGLIHADDHVWVDGVWNGQLTITAGNLSGGPAKNIILSGDLKVGDATGPINTCLTPGYSQTLGLVAQQNIIIPDTSPDPLNILGVALLAQNGRVFRPNYDANTNSQAIKQTMNFCGALASFKSPQFHYRQVSGQAPINCQTQFGGDASIISGYCNDNKTFDVRLAGTPPPEFPKTGVFTLKSWREVPAP